MSDSARPSTSTAHPGRVALVHPEQIASEQVGLLTTLGAADLHDHVLAVVGVLREQEQLQLLGEAFDVGLGRSDLVAQQSDVAVSLAEELLGRSQIVGAVLQVAIAHDDRLELAVAASNSW